jgi:hypothetical protein
VCETVHYHNRAADILPTWNDISWTLSYGYRGSGSNTGNFKLWQLELVRNTQSRYQLPQLAYAGVNRRSEALTG